MKNQDTWGKLYEIATSDNEGAAKIELNTETADKVTLVWPDGSRALLEWWNGHWEFSESISLCPRDVAARDAF